MEACCQCYCLQCTIGREAGVARQIQTETGLTALAPTLVRVEWKGRIATRREQVLFPGYVFLYTRNEGLPKLSGVRYMQRLLAYGAGQRQLYGRDAEVARSLLAYGGIIRESRVLRKGDRIVVVDGPMKDFGGVITMVNKQRQRANIEFTFEGITRSIWMAFEWVTMADNDGYCISE